LKNIKSISKALFHFIYKRVNITNFEASNIACIGESGESSLILFDSGEMGKTLTIDHLNIKNSISNGSIIKIMGNENTVILKHSLLNNLITYGSIIDNTSQKVFINLIFFFFIFFLLIIYYLFFTYLL